MKHCPRSNFSEYDVNCVNLEKGEFLVRSSSDSSKLFVNFSEPTCKCESWKRTHFPCKQFFAVFKFLEEWDFHRLPYQFKNNVFITLDTRHFDQSDEESPSEPCAMEDFEDLFSEDVTSSVEHHFFPTKIRQPPKTTSHLLDQRVIATNTIPIPLNLDGVSRKGLIR